MILSLKPPYDISSLILQLISSISIKLGEVNANFLNRQTPLLRKQNRIKTIHASLSIEGNTLSEEQITAMATVSYNLPFMWNHAFGDNYKEIATMDYIKDLFRRL